MSHYRRKSRRRCEVWMQVKEDGAPIARWRKLRRLTQRDLAYLCKCSQATISLIERGEMLTMSEDLALMIADRLAVPWEDLFVARGGAGVRRVSRAETGTGQTDPTRVPA